MKYNNKKVDGYDSKKERDRATTLKLLVKAGMISHLQEQVKYELIPSQYRIVDGKRRCIERPISYIADFQYVEGGETVVEDCKGFRTDVYIMKRKMMLYFHGIRIKEV